MAEHAKSARAAEDQRCVEQDWAAQRARYAARKALLAHEQVSFTPLPCEQPTVS